MHSDTGPRELELRLADLFAGRYTIEKEILGGGMSRVFLAREIALDRPIVIKILPPDVAAEVNRDRFRREIQFAARLQHPHVVPLLWAGEEGGLLYYTMPYIDGESLKTALGKGKRFSAAETIEILMDVAGALAYAHREGVVHRDIKPANILLKGEHAVVTDFGVAKAIRTALGNSGVSISTTTGMAIGTPEYMAPEQVAGDAAADHRIDIYAFGLLAYELLTGRSPFRGSSPQAIMAAQLTQQPEPIASLRADVPPVLAALITRCLEKEAQRRPASAESVLEVLRTIDAASGSHAHAVAERKFRRVLGWAGALGVVVVVLGLGAMFWRSQQGPPPLPLPPPTVAPKVSVADSLASARRADSIQRQLHRRDSAANSRALSQLEQRLLSRLRDSVNNAVHRADSVNEAARRVADSLQRRSGQRTPATSATLPRSIRTPLPQEFTARAASLGPPRRIVIGMSSSLPNVPDLIVAAAAMRDSLVRRLHGQGRFLMVPLDSVDAALQITRRYDSVSTLLRAEVFVMITASMNQHRDSLRWELTLRDLSAHPIYQSRNTSTARRMPFPEDRFTDIPVLFTGMVQQLTEMDRAPRKP